MNKMISSYDGHQLALLEKKSLAPCVNFLIVHGMCEHKERYEDLLNYLNERSINTYIYDLRGHGASDEKENYGYFKEGAKSLIEDLDAVIEYIKSENDLPIILLGHSMGSLIVREYLKEHDDKIAGLIVMGSPSYNPLAKWGSRLAKLLKLFKNERYRSNLIQKMALAYDKQFENEGSFAWLSSDKEVVKAYKEDDRDGFVFTLNGFMTLFGLVESVYDTNAYHVKNKDLKILFMAGETDPVIISKDDYLKAVSSLKNLYPHTSYLLYPDMRHEILNEKDKKKVFEDILDFIVQVIA